MWLIRKARQTLTTKSGELYLYKYSLGYRHRMHHKRCCRLYCAICTTNTWQKPISLLNTTTTTTNLLDHLSNQPNSLHYRPVLSNRIHGDGPNNQLVLSAQSINFNGKLPFLVSTTTRMITGMSIGLAFSSIPIMTASFANVTVNHSSIDNTVPIPCIFGGIFVGRILLCTTSIVVHTTKTHPKISLSQHQEAINDSHLLLWIKGAHHRRAGLLRKSRLWGICLSALRPTRQPYHVRW